MIKDFSLDQLRLKTVNGERIYLNDTGKQGFFVPTSDTTSSDNGQDIIINQRSGVRWKREAAPSSLGLEGNALYVSKIYGNNLTAEKGNRYKQYKDPWTAMQASVAGDRIVITDGSIYTCGPIDSGADYESDDVTTYNLAKTNRTLIGHERATISNYGTSVSASLFSDNPEYMIDRNTYTSATAGVIFKVIGNISIDWNADAPFLFQHEDTEFEGEFYDITFTSTTTYQACIALYAPHVPGWDPRNEATYSTDPDDYGGRVKRVEIKAHKIDCGNQDLYSSNNYFNFSDTAAYLLTTGNNIYDGDLFGRNQLSRGLVRITADHVIQGRAYNDGLSNYDVFLNIGYLQGSINRTMSKNQYFCARIDRAEYNPNFRGQFWFAYGGGQNTLYDIEVGSALLDSGIWIINTLGNGAVHRFKFGLLEMAPDATTTGSGATALANLGGTRVALSNDTIGKIYFEGDIVSTRAGIHGMYITNTLVGSAGTLPKSVYISNTRIYTEATANSIYSTVSNRDIYFGGGNVFNTIMRAGYVNSLGLAPTIDTNIPT